jgi:hypothetical protein
MRIPALAVALALSACSADLTPECIASGPFAAADCPTGYVAECAGTRHGVLAATVGATCAAVSNGVDSPSCSAPGAEAVCSESGGPACAALPSSFDQAGCPALLDDCGARGFEWCLFVWDLEGRFTGEVIELRP